MNTQADSQHPFDLLLSISQRSREALQPLSTAVQAPEAGGLLALRLGSWRLMFSLEEVSEIIPIPQITRVPGVKTWLLGIANLRGTVISIIDLHGFFERRSSTRTTSSRVVVVRSEEWGYGLLIDEVIGMRHFGEKAQISNLDDIDSDLRPYITNAFQSEKKKWLVFDANQLLKSSRFLDAAS